MPEAALGRFLFITSPSPCCSFEGFLVSTLALASTTNDMAVERVKQVASHLAFGSVKGRDALLRKSPDDVVITVAIRSPLCKAKKGGLKDTKCVPIARIRMNKA